MKKENNVFPKKDEVEEDIKTRKKIKILTGIISAGVALITAILLLIFLVPRDEMYEITLNSNLTQVELDGNGSYKEGQKVTIVAEQIDGYRFVGWEYNGKIISTEKEYTFEIGKNTEGVYSANYEKLYKINKETTEFGTIIIDKDEAIEGEEVEVKVTANTGYQIKRIYYIENNQLDEIEILNNKFLMPAGDVKVCVEFNIITYTITIPEDEAYEITKESNTVEHGSEYKFKITLNEAFSQSVLVVKNGEEVLSIGEDGYYTITNVTDNIIIAIEGVKKNTYTITWQNYDGSELEKDENVEYGTMPSYDGSTPTRESDAQYEYTFTGWDSEIVEATGDKVYTATYSQEIRKYLVTFGENVTVEKTEGGSITSGEEVEYGTEIKITYNEKEGYQKTSFKVNGSEVENDYRTTVIGEVNVEYIESAIEYTIIYNLDNGEIVGQKESYTIEDETFTLVTPTKEGYEFLGWTWDGQTEPQKEVTIEKGSTGNKEFTANWKINSYTITIPENEAYEITKETETVEHGSDYRFKITLNEAYTQSELVVKNGEEVLSLGDDGYYAISNVTDNISITIEGIKKNTYTITIPENIGYKLEKDSETAEHGSDYRFKITLNEEYTQSELVVKNGVNVLTADENGYYTLSNVRDNITVTIEGIKKNTYTIIWQNYDGSELEKDENVEYGTMPSYDGLTPTRESDAQYEYTFTGWDSEIVETTGDKVYKAQYSQEIRKYLVTFGENVTVEKTLGGSITSGEEVEYGTEIKITYKEKEGYQKTSFKVNEQEVENEYTITVAEDIIVEYLESAIEYTITYNLDNGEIAGQKESYTIEDETFILATPTKEGYEFLGWTWDGQAEPQKEVTIEKGSTGNKEFTANWIQKYQLSIDSNVSDIVTLSANESASDNEIAVNVSDKYKVIDDTIFETNNLYYMVEGDETKYSVNAIDGVYKFSMPEGNVTVFAEGYRRLDDFEIDGDTIVGYTGSDSEVVIPSMYSKLNINNTEYIVEKEGNNIINIGDYAFSSCSSLTKIEIPEGVTRIGSGTFCYCSSLTSITLPSTLTSIGESTFYYCSSLTSITLPSTLTSIGDYAFSSCDNLTTITIPDSVTSIGESTFYYCSSLTSITLPSTLTSISGSAFSHCSSLTSITLPTSLTSIGDYAFYNCRSLTSITIPDSVKSIGNSAFDNCCALAIVYNNSDLSITLGSMTYGWVGYHAKEIVNKGQEAEGIIEEIDNVFYYINKTKNQFIALGSSVVNPTTIILDTRTTEINRHAFFKCSSLTIIEIPEGVIIIGSSAFNGCISLTSITLPSTLTSIGSNAFYECYALAIVYNNSDLSIILGESYDYGQLGYYAKEVVNKGQEAEGRIEKIDNVFYYINETKNQFIALGSSVVNPTTITLNERTTEINQFAFYNCSSLTSITLPSTLTSIGDYAFFNCSSLTSITLPSTLTSIGDYAFSICNNLTTITIPDSVTSIGDSAFSSCSSLTSITLPSTLTSIGDYAFSSCSKLTSITLPSTLTSIGDYAFRYCSKLTSITLPSTLTSIGSNAFQNCSRLTEVFIENEYVYNNATSTTDCGSLLQYATTVKVLKTIVDDTDNTNTYLNDSSNYTKTTSSDGQYYIYTKVA